MMILGVDPGGTTGLVKVLNGEVVEDDQLNFADTVRWLDRETPSADLIVVERFIISGRTVAGSREGTMDALHLVGVCRALGQLHNVPVMQQTPADAKNAFNDSVLRRTGYYDKVHGKHSRDALRHVLLAIRKTIHTTDKTEGP